jgi:hypothetical protein
MRFHRFGWGLLLGVGGVTLGVLPAIHFAAAASPARSRSGGTTIASSPAPSAHAPTGRGNPPAKCKDDNGAGDDTNGQDQDQKSKDCPNPDEGSGKSNHTNGGCDCGEHDNARQVACGAGDAATEDAGVADADDAPCSSLSIVVTPRSQTIYQGNHAVYTGSVSFSSLPVKSTITLGVSNLPPGATGTFSPASAAVSGNGSFPFTLTVTTLDDPSTTPARPATTPGIYDNMTISASTPAAVNAVMVTLIVKASPCQTGGINSGGETIGDALYDPGLSQIGAPLFQDPGTENPSDSSNAPFGPLSGPIYTGSTGTGGASLGLEAACAINTVALGGGL